MTITPNESAAISTCLRPVEGENDTAAPTHKKILGWPIQAFFWLEWGCCGPQPSVSLGARPRDLQFAQSACDAEESATLPLSSRPKRSAGDLLFSGSASDPNESASSTPNA